MARVYNEQDTCSLTIFLSCFLSSTNDILHELESSVIAKIHLGLYLYVKGEKKSFYA